MKTTTFTVVIGRITTDATNLRKEDEKPLFKTQLAVTFEGLADDVQSTFWYDVLISSEKLAAVLKKGTAVMVKGQVIPNVYQDKVSFHFRNAEITLLEPPAKLSQKVPDS
ncbi:MAG: single-stranded DNA-binding protein [Bacteroidota bacterium]